MRSGNWRVARLAGVDVLIGPPLLLMGALLVLVFAPRFDQQGASSGYAAATLFVLGLYFSVFLHEVAHMLAARGYRMRVRSITLHLLGGETAIEDPSRTPTQEFVIAVVGPIMSIGLGVACFVLGAGNPIIGGLGWINIVVGVFNLLPGLPLDGGRALRALIWSASGRPEAGTRFAAWAGRIIAVALVVAVLFRVDFDGPTWSFDLAIAVFVAWFLWDGASHALARLNR